MASYGDVLAALKDYRTDLEQSAQNELEREFGAGGAGMTTFAARGGVSAFATPLNNVHATGVGVRVRQNIVRREDFVIKVYVFEKLPMPDPVALAKQFQGIEVDVEPLPIQLALKRKTRAAKAQRPKTARAQAGTATSRDRHRPIVGGVSIAPLNESFVGTLGCFVRRVVGGSEQLFALSNNHVMADTNRLSVGTPIVQPGPEVLPTTPDDAFAALSAFIPIDFPLSRLSPVTNRFDAAIAVVTNTSLIRQKAMFQVPNYDPKIATAVPGMRVIKSGRTTGVTTGVVTATRVNGVQINYGTRTSPRIATFNDTVQIVGDNNVPFSSPGDSGSVILDAETGRPIALLFAGDGRTTTACDFGGVCQQFQVLPV